MIEGEETGKKVSGHVLGASLETLSVGDLDALEADLLAELERVRAEKSTKNARMDAAQSLFKS